jgi:hypothetical protein
VILSQEKKAAHFPELWLTAYDDGSGGNFNRIATPGIYPQSLVKRNVVSSTLTVHGELRLVEKCLNPNGET